MTTLSTPRSKRRTSATLFAVAGGLGVSSLGLPSVIAQAPSVTITVDLNKETAPPAAEQAYFNGITSQFHKEHPNATVKFEFWTSVTQENTSIETLAVSHSGPDILALGSSLDPTAYATNAFRVLSNADWKILGGRAQFLPGQLSTAGPSPAQDIGVPDRTTGFGVLYNKALFRSAGITSFPTSWSQFVADAQKLTRPKKHVWGVAMDPADSKDPWHILWTLALQDGGQLLNAKAKVGLLTSKVVKSQAAFYLDWISKFHIASQQDTTSQFDNSLAQFLSGDAAMMMPVGVSALPRLMSSPQAHNFGIFPMPTIPYGLARIPKGGLPAESWGSQEDYLVSKYSPNTTLDLDLIKLIIDPHNQDLVQKNEGYIPTTKAGVAADAALRKAPYPELIKIIDGEYPTAWTSSWGTLEVAVAKAINTVADDIATSGNYTPAQLDAALAQSNSELTLALQAGAAAG